MIELHPDQLRLLQCYSRDLSYHSIYHPLELLELHMTGKTRGIELPRYENTLGPWENEVIVSAIIAHDVVYVPGAPKGENEQRSYEKWCEVDSMSQVDSFNQAVKTLILATASHQMDREYEWFERPLVAHMIDLDMSVLGADKAEFDRNSWNVAKELVMNGVYTPDQVLRGRLKFYESVLKQDRIYFTDQFYDALEVKARKNMGFELDRG